MGDIHTITVTLCGLLTCTLTSANPWLIAGVIGAAFVTTAVIAVATTASQEQKEK